MSKKLLFLLLLTSSPCKAALDFAATGYIDLVTNATKIQITTFTFMTWTRLTAVQTQREFITCTGANDGSTEGYGLGVDDTTNNFIKFYTATAAGVSHNLVSASSITTGEWHHVAFTYSSQSSGGLNKFIYMDGVLSTSTISSLQIGYGTSKCGLATWRHPGLQYLNGQMDDARFYNRVLSVNEIRTIALSKQRLPCTIDIGCVAYWKMDEGLPGIVTSTNTTLSVLDSSGNGVHGTPQNIAAPVYGRSVLNYQ